MFDSILKSKFYTKCKSSTKRSRTRINMIMRRRNTMHKYLKNDIIDLLRHGLDINAYGRSEGLLVELNLSACYALVEKFCKCTRDNLSLMSKQRECPHACKEAVSSLIYAAARFADLPELRDLRSALTDRYGSSLEAHVNKEFIEKLKGIPPTKGVKFQLLQEIAVGSGLNWDSKALEQKLYHSTIEQDWPVVEVPNDGNSILRNKRKYVSIASEKEDPLSKKDQINSEMKINKESLKEQLIPPPYAKTKKMEQEAKVKDPTAEHSVALETKPKPKSVRRHSSLIFPPENENNRSTRVDEEKDFLKPPPPLQPTRRTRTMNISIDSLEPEMAIPEHRHVHPNLPDYDAFVARLTTLKRR